MKNTIFHVYEIGLNGAAYQLSSDAGFTDESVACTYALARAGMHWNEPAVWVVVSDSRIVAAYPSARARLTPKRVAKRAPVQGELFAA